MTHVPRRDFNALRALAASRKAKRAAKGIALGIRANRKPRRKPSARHRAFARLKELAKSFTLLRAKRRNGGLCEVAVICGGSLPAVLAYHVFPSATGNALKYDPRDLLGACSPCNGGEYFDRKRGSYARWIARHKAILGPALYEQLYALQGRRQISTAEAQEMADRLQAKIEAGDYA